MKNYTSVSTNKIPKFISIRYLLGYLVIFLMSMLVISPEKFIISASQGISLWATNLLPALFPFFVFSKIIMELNILEDLTNCIAPLMRKLFHTSSNSGYLFLISIISGYPVGSKLVSDAYKLGKISYTDMHRIITFTSFSGPLFIVGTIGVNMLTNSYLGYIILASHILASILNGVLYRNYVPKMKEPQHLTPIQPVSNNILTDAVLDSIKSILLIGGLVCVFYVGMEAINAIIPLPAITQGFIEITKGCFEVTASNITEFAKVVICTGIVTFGGLCTHSQSMYFLNDCKVSYLFFLVQKITQTILACIICTIIYFIVY